jgi:adenosylcobinamide kinase/adenosylcobinamide-phosphate guanylyltransferase
VTSGRVLVLGGARSGKSAFAESLLAEAVSVDYVATAVPVSSPDARGAGVDAEWAARVRAHRARRPSHWATIETTELVPVLAPAPSPAAGNPVLLDSVTAWLTAVMDQARAWEQHDGWRESVDAQVAELTQAWAASARTVVAVSDEVGGGIVPDSAAGRMFRDELGTLNQRLAAGADRVWLITAGLAQQLK